MTLQAAQIIAAPGHQREVDGRDAARQVHVPRSTTTPTSSMVKEAIEELFKVTVIDVNVLDHQGQGEVTQPPARPRRGLDLALEEGRRDPGQRPEDRILRGGLDDAAAQLQAHLRRPPFQQQYAVFCLC